MGGHPLKPYQTWLHPKGYVWMYLNGVKMLEHRHVMSQKLGRKLLPDEQVHHKNGIKHDNEESNLELWSKSQPSGQRVSDKIAWARRFLERYGYIVTKGKQ